MPSESLISTRTTSQFFMAAADRWANRSRWKIPEKNSWKSISWQSHGQCVYRLAAALHSLGYTHNDKLGILAPNSLDWINAGLGIMCANLVLVPIYAGNTPQQSAYLIRHSQMKVIFLKNAETLNLLGRDVINNTALERIVLLSGHGEENQAGIEVMPLQALYRLGASILEENPNLIQELAEKPKPDDIAYMIYTSGTTGNPKGVPLSHKNLAASTRDWLEINGPLIPERAVDIHWLPNSHIYGWGAIGLGNIFGFESYLGTPLTILELLPRLKPHILMSVPAHFEKLHQRAVSSSKDKKVQLNTLRKMTGGRLEFLLSGGAGLKLEVKEFFLEAGMWITEGYGLSECSPTLTMNRKDAYRFDSVGLPFPSVQLKLAGDNEILAKGDNVFPGYFMDSKATKAAFTKDGWFKTGDVGQWLEGEFLKIIDRKKDIIVTTGGKNITPQVIEEKILNNPFIEHAVIYGDGEKYIVALITLNETEVKAWADNQKLPCHGRENPGNTVELHQIIQKFINQVNKTLASFETIKYFKIIPDHFTPENGLLTAALKVRRKAVHNRYKSVYETLYQ